MTKNTPLTPTLLLLSTVAVFAAGAVSVLLVVNIQAGATAKEVTLLKQDVGELTNNMTEIAKSSIANSDAIIQDSDLITNLTRLMVNLPAPKGKIIWQSPPLASCTTPSGTAYVATLCDWWRP